ncbi:hypothetical protein GGI20_005456 [Coemansia sp. BCRC 34301]|nr:hypothetical protein GGI20_005456 [Coemansia sp. BCRC 34301]
MGSDDEHSFGGSGGGGLNLASSSLFGAQLNCAASLDLEEQAPSPSNLELLQQQARPSVRFDPLAQLLGSDTEDDTTDAAGDSDSEIGDKENSPVGRPSLPLSAAHSMILGAQTTSDEEEEERRRPFSTARFALNRGADSIVARLASSRRSRAVSDSSSEEEDTSGPRQRTMSSLRLDSDSDSDSDSGSEPLPVTVNAPSLSLVPAKKPRPPRKSKKTLENDAALGERPASKAALAKIHQETERLVRETAVLINPLDYTQRLIPDDFFTRFDLYSAAATASVPDTLVTQPKLKPAELPQHTFHYESDSGDYEVEIVDDDHIAPLSLGPSVLSPLHKPPAAAVLSPSNPLRGSHTTDLDSILEYASQPLRSSAPAAVRRPPTDGPMGLRELNGALMRAMYKHDEEALRAATAESAPTGAATADVGENVDEGGERETDGHSAGSDGDEGSASESGLEDIDAVLSPRTRRRPAAVISDDDDDGDDDDDEPIAPATTRPLLEPGRKAQRLVRESSAVVVSSDKEKTKFLGMFKMPAPKKPFTAKQPVVLSPPPQPASVEAEPTPSQPSQPEIPVSASQDFSYLFPSQAGIVSDTQDSLLMTPAEEVSGGRQHDSIMDTQTMSYSGHLEQFPEYPITQPTQMMDHDHFSDDKEEVGRVRTVQVTQQTQLTEDTGSDAGDSVLPTMVRQALVAGASSDLDESGGEEAGDVGDESPSPQPRVPVGRLLRRGNVEAQRKQKRRNARRSEFVEAEAEEGDSFESDGETTGAGARKFNWGDGGPVARQPANDSDSDSEDDMDSEEEEAALLADPMINNEIDENESEGDEAIRELHRQRDFDEDEANIQTLYNDITTGALKNRRALNRTGFALADDEDYNDRQTRAERMEERARMNRKLMAREIHDKDLAEIAKNPETAAFARAALMRPPPPTSAPGSSSSGTAVGEPDDDEMLMLPGDDAFELEEIVDDRHVAMAVQQQLTRTRMRVDSDDDEDPSTISLRWPAAARIAGRPLGSSQASAMTDSLPMDDMEGDAFSSVSVEKLIVRRRTLLAATGKDDSKLSSSNRGSSLLKRPGTALLGATAKRLNVTSGNKKTT